METHTLLADDGTFLTLPVTPKAWKLPAGKDYKIVNLAELGEYILPGHPTLGNIKVPDVLIPAHSYPFCAAYRDPDIVIAWLERMALERRRLRYVIAGGTVPVSWPCYLVSVEFGEQDGTGDLYADLILQQWASADAPLTQKKRTAQRDEPVQETVTQEKTHTVAAGENLWTICRSYYSDGGLSAALAAYNGIKNANIIAVGQVLKIPPVSSLSGTKAQSARRTVSR
ncbi:MAG: LysM peptidoglycan-binding domain-containing protein [Oscillospiraceae bacterium]|nr:LysM peptidoglycan-binding domain-containing protein [Oscillospiraceae bacterium]